jgi:uncharacterized protein (TIGR00661 family)
MITRKPVVLLAPLDWGLGHTTRCIPIIKELLGLDCEVLVACNQKQKLLLREEFSSIDFVHLNGYEIRYGKNRLRTLLNLLVQGPKIFNKISRERRWLREFLIKNNVNAVISDNRYGLFSDTVTCIFITHQLRVISGMGKIVDHLIQKFLYSYISRFNACWIPDWKDPTCNAGGQLSHPQKFPGLAVHYLGCLSRFEKCSNHSKKIDLLIILSGPEPQRTILEKIIFSQLKTFGKAAVVVRGIFDDSTIPSFDGVTVLNYASSSELNGLICNSEIIVTRAGYTSIMDLLKLGKKSVLIPTPGQAEQEYLADYLHQKKFAYALKQADLCLETALDKAMQLPDRNSIGAMDQYKEVLEKFVGSLKAANMHQSS